MLEVTRLNGKKVVINCDLIEYIDANPDTTISLTTGNRFVVKEPLSEVIEKIVEFKRSINDGIKITYLPNETKE